jgi:signal transduction histidine kinase
MIWARTNTKGMFIQKKVFPLNRLVEFNLDFFALTLAQKQVRIVSNIQEITTIYGDEDLLRIALRNVINNAIKFSNSNSTIEISSYSHLNYDIIQVKDFGLGMSDETIEQLESGTKVQSKYGTKGESGNGIGYELVRRILKNHEGVLRIESTVGKGSVIRLLLPKLD